MFCLASIQRLVILDVFNSIKTSFCRVSTFFAILSVAVLMVSTLLAIIGHCAKGQKMLLASGLYALAGKGDFSIWSINRVINSCFLRTYFCVLREKAKGFNYGTYFCGLSLKMLWVEEIFLGFPLGPKFAWESKRGYSRLEKTRRLFYIQNNVEFDFSLSNLKTIASKTTKKY